MNVPYRRPAAVASRTRIQRALGTPPRRGLLAGILLACGWCPPLLGAAPHAADFPELAAACRSLEAFVVDNRIVVGDDGPAAKLDAQRSCTPLPAAARMLAYEEHAQFLYAVGDASHSLGAGPPANGRALVRRFLFLRPDIFVVDDFVRPAAAQTEVRWTIQFRGEPQVAGRQLRLAGDDRHCVCETLYPAGAMLQRAPRRTPGEESGPWFAVAQKAAAQGGRWLHVAQLQRAGQAAAKTAWEDKDGEIALTITTTEKVVRLTLPPSGSDAGWIAILAADGKPLIPRRPLALGVLPHGPEGARLIERWDSAYRGDRAGWDTGAPAPELKRVVESGLVKPCRTVTFGCGTGASDIYLASKGFDVTAIDVAPTALGIAQQKAEQAGVHVRWVLADVLHLPDLGQFDFFFDRGCYHHVRHVDAAGFQETLRRLSRPGTRGLILSCNNDRPPGVREHHMRSDFAALFHFEWLRDSGVENRDGKLRRESWSLMVRRK